MGINNVTTRISGYVRINNGSIYTIIIEVFFESNRGGVRVGELFILHGQLH